MTFDALNVDIPSPRFNHLLRGIITTSERAESVNGVASLAVPFGECKTSLREVIVSMGLGGRSCVRICPMQTYQHVYFEPWRGPNYGPNSKFGLALLIVGEAHYDWEEGAPQLERGLTKELIAYIAAGQETKAFWTKICKLFEGDVINPQTKKLFWESVAFYNYIQKSVGLGARVRPTPEMWSGSQEAYLEVLSCLKPQCIIVLGEDTWNHLPLGKYWRVADERFGSGPALAANGMNFETRVYQVDGDKPALATKVKHPSAVGFSTSEWRPVVQRTIEHARTL
jgi:hypothetical protein